MANLTDILKKASPITAGIGAVGGIAQGIFSLIQGAKMLKEAKKINPVYKAYETSPYAKAGLGLAQISMGAKNPALAAAERQMMAGQANALAAGQRAGLGPAEQAAMALASQGQMESGIERLGQQNLAFYQQNKADLFRAQEAMTGEERMKYQDMITKFQMDREQKNMLRSAGQQNIIGGLGRIASTGYGLAGMSTPGGGNRGVYTGGQLNQGVGFSDFMNTSTGTGTRYGQRISPWD